MSFKFRFILILLISCCCIGCDQGSKGIAKAYLLGGDTYSFLFDCFRIGYAENSGVFLGMGAAWSEDIRFLLFGVGVGIVLLGLLIYMLLARNMDKPTLFGLSLVFSGGISNFIDRMTQNGVVVDFLNVGIGSLRTGIFNVADMLILLGVICILYLQWKSPPVYTD